MNDYELGRNDGIQDRLDGYLPINWQNHVDDYLYCGRLNVNAYKSGYRDGWDWIGEPAVNDNDGLILSDDDLRDELREADLAEIGI
ncbi:hypothetical protein [Bifidobacterium sp. SO1]|uniref:hypothetical protein n=1 Tax=Bifidobacterium sp. SO1 TaxID=2809029 RepID=UPI001BDD9081|nr:hypothetical protein [Bifidobacterium sp. SO1]MBT1162204.1 hypothetical protein [Bifidobacterium sp. SO1]